jgi:hypothetical protein
MEQLLINSTVRLRGWPVPFVDHREPVGRGQDWIGQDIDARLVAHEEAWRFFTSGQFAQLRVISADRRVGREATPVPLGASSVIEVWEILFYVTEVVELAARLSLTEAGSEEMVLDLRLHGVEGRQLVSGSPTRELNRAYRANTPTLQAKRSVDREALVSNPRHLAVELSRSILFRFGWQASEDVLKTYQRELIGE